jgi:hypothetical protein
MKKWKETIAILEIRCLKGHAIVLLIALWCFPEYTLENKEFAGYKWKQSSRNRFLSKKRINLLSLPDTAENIEINYDSKCAA